MRNRIAAMFMAAMTGMAAMLTPEGMVINEGNAPYVALGSDLTEDEREEVLELLELEPEQLTEDTVTELTAEDERHYAGEDADRELLSDGCVISCSVRPLERGSGITVDTRNIGGAVPEMYINALATCGMEDAGVMIVSPVENAGVAGVSGAMKAYSKMNGHAIEPDVVQMATGELMLQMAIAAYAEDTERPAEFDGLLKRVVLNNRISDPAEIRSAALDIASQLDLRLTDEDTERSVDIMGRILEMNPDIKILMLQSEPVYMLARERGLDLTAYGIDLADDGTFFGKLRALFEKNEESDQSAL